MARLNEIIVAWHKGIWSPEGPDSEGYNFKLSREQDCITKNVRGSLTQGNQHWRISMDEVASLIKRMRENIVNNNGQVYIWFVWSDRQETVYRRGKYKDSLRYMNEQDIIPESLPSQAADMLVQYLQTGDEATFNALLDYLSDKFPRSVK